MLLSDERTQLAVFARFIDSTTHTVSEKIICVRKLGESKRAASIMAELEEMFAEKYINKSLIRFSTWTIQMQWVVSITICFKY